MYDAIFRRKSTRKYSQESLSKEELEDLNEKITSTDVLFEDSEISVKLKDRDDVDDFLSGLIGNYGKIEAPHYLVAFTEQEKGHLENLGYFLEKIVLEATRKEIATCWMGSHFDKEALREGFEFDGKLEPRVLVAFGMPEGGVNALREGPEEASRNVLSNIVLNDLDELSEEWRKILDAARMSPSAMNSQPWRFEVDDDGVHLYIKVGKGIVNKLGEAFGNLGELNRVDAGIALRHVQIAADKFSKELDFERLEGKGKEDLTYVISAREKD